MACCGIRRNRTDHDLFVRRNVEIDLRPVRDELLFLGRRVIPQHLPRFLDQDCAALGQLFLQDTALIRVHEVRGKVFDRVVFALQRFGQLRRCGVRGAGVDNEKDGERRTRHQHRQ